MAIKQTTGTKIEIDMNIFDNLLKIWPTWTLPEW
jgi:hypothetical protein